MGAVSRISSGLLLITSISLLVFVAGCRNNNGSTDDALPENNPEAGAAVADDAPEPMSVNADELEIIDEWREAGVPRFPNGEVLDFEPHASQIENGGTLLLDGAGASSEEVISFYRGALAALGWQERRVGDREMTAESDVASLLVAVSESDGQTSIMMILTDSLGNH